MKFGVQLFGVLIDQPGKTLEVLQSLAEAGISEVEPCVSIEPMPGMEHAIWPAAWLEENIGKIKGMGLEIKSAHLFAENVNACAPALKRLAEKVGLKQYVLKSPQELTDGNLQQSALSYMKLADDLSGCGVKILLHNEGTDISTKFAGKSAYEYLLDLCQGKVFAQVDVGWVLFAGEDPAAFLWRNGGRVLSLHYKDYAAGAKEPHDVPIGTGALDIPACFRYAKAKNIPQLIDQEHFGPDRARELAEIAGQLNQLGQSRDNTVSYLNSYDIETGEIRTLARFEGIIEAPNWLKNSEAILYNAEGHMYRFDLASGQSTLLDTGLCDNCNNDHVVSADERAIAVSHMTFDQGFTSHVYIVPFDGGEAKLVTPNSPSFLHGWSPDGKEMAYCAFREIDGKLEVDVYTIPAQGGEEKRLTGGGFNDGPEYSPDGKYIWYNSTKSGLMQIWRMRTDGSEQTQITKNEKNNWFAHISPDGEKVVYLAYAKDQLEPREHLANMPVELWQMNADGTDQHKILSLFGGQGSLNVNSWAGDSRHFAFVSYELI